MNRKTKWGLTLLLSLVLPLSFAKAADKMTVLKDHLEEQQKSGAISLELKDIFLKLAQNNSQSIDIVIVSHPQDKEAPLQDISKKYTWATRGDSKEFSTLDMADFIDEKDFINKLTNDLKKKSVFYIKNADLLSDKSQEFISNIKKDSEEGKSILFILSTSAGQGSIKVTSNSTKEEIKQALEIEGLSTSLLNESKLSIITPDSDYAIKEKLNKTIKEALLDLKKQYKKTAIIKDKQKLIDAMFYEYYDAQKGFDFKNASKKIKFSISKAYKKEKNKQKKQKKINIYALSE